LLKKRHVQFLRDGVVEEGLPETYVGLDASRPWLLYWSLHALDLLDALDEELCARGVSALLSFQCPHGGFGGGPQADFPHLAHLAPTYASLLGLVVAGNASAWKEIDRSSMKAWLKRLKQPNGSFRMHEPDGETDVRAAYCAVVVGWLTDCWDEELEKGLIEWIVQCQSWEGAFGGVPGAEAHGGYTYCALAALAILHSNEIDGGSRADLASTGVNVPRLTAWLTSQQIDLAGGFRGRTNKLVDSCYSFWQTACLVLLQGYQNTGLLFDPTALQQFILGACQSASGGLKDKPGKQPDFYHTCYALSGLSLAQHSVADTDCLVGGQGNLLPPIDPRFNARVGKPEAAKKQQ
jgi:protein farnesyltransferase subunit beta